MVISCVQYSISFGIGGEGAVVLPLSKPTVRTDVLEKEPVNEAEEFDVMPWRIRILFKSPLRYVELLLFSSLLRT